MEFHGLADIFGLLSKFTSSNLKITSNQSYNIILSKFINNKHSNDASESIEAQTTVHLSNLSTQLTHGFNAYSHCLVSGADMAIVDKVLFTFAGMKIQKTVLHMYFITIVTFIQLYLNLRI